MKHLMMKCHSVFNEFLNTSEKKLKWMRKKGQYYLEIEKNRADEIHC